MFESRHDDDDDDDTNFALERGQVTCSVDYESSNFYYFVLASFF
jgi:hypothetical protein